MKPEDRALITFTSGTSGQPKGADRTYGFLAAQLTALSPHLKRPTVDRDFTNFPIVGLADLAVGNTVVIPNLNLMRIHEADPAPVANTLLHQQVTRLIVSPSLLGLTLSQLPPHHLLQEVYTGGAPIPFYLITHSLTHHSHITFRAIFGSTEAEPVALTTFDIMQKQMQDPLKGVFLGTPEPVTSVCLVPPTQGPLTASVLNNPITTDGEVGEIIVSGSHVNTHYFENEAAFKEHKIVDDAGNIWHRMGDLAYWEKGNLYLVGRLHRVMRRGEKAYHPFPFEEYVRRKLGWTDVGYVQEGKMFRLYVYTEEVVLSDTLKHLTETPYPLDEICFLSSPLPRDPRHRAKLDVVALKKRRVLRRKKIR
ncbi:MAG: AMP-binding protein [Bacteroidota bacterium]